jgi:hypothetical protein
MVVAGGLSVSGSVVAGEEGCSSLGSLDCQGCQQLFADNNRQLTDELAKMSCCNESSCCAPTSVCAEAGCADGCAEGCCSLDECGSGIEFGGWAQVGYHSGSTGLFNDNPDRLNLHQLWGYVEKVADGSCGMDFGFRADLMFGVDSEDTQAFGNNSGRWDHENGWQTDNSGYGFALPQLYAEVASGDLSVIVGHFYTLLGYEVVTAPDNSSTATLKPCTTAKLSLTRVHWRLTLPVMTLQFTQGGQLAGILVLISSVTAAASWVESALPCLMMRL